jgi:SAM-dependent methyltransferase
MTACPLCRQSGTERLFDKATFRYSRCPGCDAASLDPLPTESAAADLYGLSYFTGGAAGAYDDYARDEEIHRANARKRLRILERAALTAPGRLVDVGSAFGFFLDEARSAGWRVFGVDVSAAARLAARDRFGLETFPDLESFADETSATVDVVTFFQSLEHMVHPDQALERARSVLTPHGGLVIETWNRSSPAARLLGSQWHQVTPPSVVHLFNRRSLAALLERSGFSIRTIRATTKYVSLGAVAYLLSDKHPAARGLLGPITDGPGTRIRVRYGFGDLITVVANPA